MRIGSCFSGIGGLELGLEWAGVGHTVWQVERDPFCRQVLAKHWPDAVRHDDVRTVGAHNLEPVDVICGGYPCQPFSTSGRREGDRDPRHLWPEYVRTIRDFRPDFAVLENVAGHLSLGFSSVLADLASIGFDAEWSVVSACSVGAPHMRPRLFAISYPTGERQPRQGRAIDAGHRQAHRGGAADHAVDVARWAREPEPPGVAYGVRYRMDRLTALGNAVVPKCAEVVGRRLLEIDAVLRQEVAA